jgi:signal transduction histidine kinase
VRAAGFAVDLVFEGAADALPPAVGLTAYRIVQEALTNAMRHGRPTQIRVLVRCGVEAVDLVVENDGLGAEASLVSGPSAAGGQPGSRGQGLVAMRERASLVGGSVTAGPAAGGWRVHARLPVAADGVR